MFFFLWLIETIIFTIVFSHRIILASRIFDFRADCSNPLDCCALFNQNLLAELILHTIYTIFAIIIPFRSIFLFLSNVPLICWGWYSYLKKTFYFSPFQLVRDAKKSQKACIISISVFFINSLILVYKLLIVSIVTNS